MNFKVMLFSVACIVFVVPPVHSGNIKSAAINAVREIVSLGKNVKKAKGAAVVRGATDVGAIIATAMGLKIRALAQASSSIKGAYADGFLAAGDSIRKAGDIIVESKLGNSSSRRSIQLAPRIAPLKSPVTQAPVVKQIVETVNVPAAVVAEKVVRPYDLDTVVVPVESIPLRPVQRPEVIVEPSARMPAANKVSVFDNLQNAARSKVNRVPGFFKPEGSRTVEAPIYYEIIDTPQVFQGPLFGTFQIQRK